MGHGNHLSKQKDYLIPMCLEYVFICHISLTTKLIQYSLNAYYLLREYIKTEVSEVTSKKIKVLTTIFGICG